MMPKLWKHPAHAVRFSRPALLLLLAVVTAGDVLGSDGRPAPPGIQNALSRPGMSLDGAWDVIVDPFENGYYSHRWQPKPDGYFEDREPSSPSDLVEYDFDTSQKLTVPGDWNSQDERLFFYEGTIWYRKRFDLTPAPGRRQVLHFGAVNYQAEVWVNGEHAGGHVGGFTPFDLEVTPFLEAGVNTVIVKVDNRRRRDNVPTLNTDWWNYGGITRPVRLLSLPSTFVRDYGLRLDPADPARVIGHVQLDGNAAGRPVTVSLPGAGLDVSVTTDDAGIAEFSLPAPPERWSPDRPTLYEVRIEAGDDSVSDRVGFRTFERRGEDLLLNGEPLFLRGVCLHEERPGGGRAHSREHADTLLGWARDLGANFVRLAHYPHNEAMLRRADELGLLVWSEIPVYWTILFDQPAVLENARRQLTEMIHRDRNRASVVLWSIANETPVSEARTRFLASLAGTIRELDDSRLVTAALDTQIREGNTRVIEDPLGEVVDVIGINSYCGWYSGTPESCTALRWRSDFGKPVIMSEFGGGAKAGLRGSPDLRWSEDYQAEVYRHNLEMLEQIPFLRGTSPWILMDFRSPRRPLPGIQDFWNRKGLVDPDGRRKLAFDLLKDWYAAPRQGEPGSARP